MPKLQTEYEQHCRRHDQRRDPAAACCGAGVVAAGNDGDVLLAARRIADGITLHTRASVELPELGEGITVPCPERPVVKAAEHDSTTGRQRTDFRLTRAWDSEVTGVCVNHAATLDVDGYQICHRIDLDLLRGPAKALSPQRVELLFGDAQDCLVGAP